MKKHINHSQYEPHMPDVGSGMRMAIYTEYRVVDGKLKMTTVTRQYHENSYSDTETIQVISDAQ